MGEITWPGIFSIISTFSYRRVAQNTEISSGNFCGWVQWAEWIVLMQPWARVHVRADPGNRSGQQRWSMYISMSISHLTLHVCSVKCEMNMEMSRYHPLDFMTQRTTSPSPFHRPHWPGLTQIRNNTMTRKVAESTRPNFNL